MKKRLRQIYKKIDTSYPFIGSLFRSLYYRSSSNTVTRKIHGKNNFVSYKNAKLTGVIIDMVGNDNMIQIMEGCTLNNLSFYIRGNNHNILINKKCSFDGGNIWFEDCDCSLVIGENSTFGDVHLALTEPGSKIIIGRDCLFSSDIDVRTGDSHSIFFEKTNERINYAEDVSISDHVWITAHSILLKGSFIPENSVVATGSVVTKRFETKGIIIGGNPAIQLKEGIMWARKRIYRNE